MSRAKHTFDQKTLDQVAALARCHCPDHEIAAFAGCSEATLKRHLSELLSIERAKGAGNIRAMQYKKAMEGDKCMLIWVGKQICGQTEKLHTTDSTLPKVVTINRLNGDKTIYETQFVKKKRE